MGRRTERAVLQRQVEVFNARSEVVKAWERLVQVGERLREAGRRIQERLSQEVDSLRKRQDYVEGLYKQVYREGVDEFLMRRGADRTRAELERRIQELPETERNALNRRAQSRSGLRRSGPSRLPERDRDYGPSR